MVHIQLLGSRPLPINPDEKYNDPLHESNHKHEYISDLDESTQMTSCKLVLNEDWELINISTNLNATCHSTLSNPMSFEVFLSYSWFPYNINDPMGPVSYF